MFFDLIDEKIEQGLEPTEISYQMAFSKAELRKLVAMYPGKEVKKGLEHLYEKVEKHLCEEENLLQVGRKFTDCPGLGVRERGWVMEGG